MKTRCIHKFLTALALTLVFIACSDQPLDEERIFVERPLKKAGIDFVNQLEYSEEVNVYTFRNFYNGAGVGIGDFNRDGLVDLFFCGNQVDNKLYLNKGDFQFEDITDAAGVRSQNVWSTGVSVVDINGDGWLDIYVCKSGDLKGENRHNELFLNQGYSTGNTEHSAITFIEVSKSYGLDDVGLSTHAGFFDYDLDGDLDCYLLNNSFRSVGNYDLRPDQRSIRDPEGGNKLYRNNAISVNRNSGPTVFEDVSEQAGIYGSSIGFGLGVTLGDVNRDGWPDIFVSNDFFEKDYLYLNQGDGTFVESIDAAMPEISMGSMGADMADINNDGLPEIFVTEMLPFDESRIKTKAQFENWNKYSANIEGGYHRQFGRNVLQLNRGNGSFSEVGRYAGVEATDWSWGALIFDMDNDGYKDLFVANGIFKDLLDQDYINFYSDPEEVRKVIFDRDGGIAELIDKMPSEPLINHAYRNKGNLQFELVSDQWGFDRKTFSNGAAYADLDNDGDLDLVINNINMPPLLYENKTVDRGGSHFLQLDVRDSTAMNYYALGAQVTLYRGTEVQYQEISPARGFMSSVDGRIHFGLGDIEKVDSVVIRWPDGIATNLIDVSVDQNLIVYKPEKKNEEKIPDDAGQTMLSRHQLFKPSFRHAENAYSDFDREPLLLQMHDNEGPACCVGDINNDGLDDFFVGGAKGQTGRLFIQNKNGSFGEITIPALVKHAESEDVVCLFFDANGDRRADLYVGSGSSEFGPNSGALRDRLYLNRPSLLFELSDQLLPTFRFENTSAVKDADIDQDGDRDLIVTSFIRPLLYGMPSSAYILVNDGKGNFKNVSEERAPGFADLGMISDVATTDMEGDGDQDIIMVGEWMGIRIFVNTDGFFEELQASPVADLKGMWNDCLATDLNGDGLDEIVLGNMGLNSRMKASKDRPFRMYLNDFDQNGRPEQVFAYASADGDIPIAQRNDLLRQLPYLSKQFPDFNSYKGQTIQTIFSEEQVQTSLLLEITELRSGILWNLGGGQFNFVAFPDESQLSPVYAVEAIDINGDDRKDLILGGNQYHMKPEMGIQAAGYGHVLIAGEGESFYSMSRDQTGFFEAGQIRAIRKLNVGPATAVLIAKNNDNPTIYVKN